MRRLLAVVGVIMVLGLSAAPVLAAETADKAAGEPAVAASSDMGKGLGVLGACVGASLAVVGGAMGIARIGAACVESIARQPEASGSLFAPMIITAAMIEGGMLFAIVVGLLAALK